MMTWPNPDRRPSTVSGDTLQFLREFRGEKFTAGELAVRIDHNPAEVFKTLVARYHNGRYGLFRERGWGFEQRWWIAEVGDFAAAGEARVIAKWMVKHRIAARATAIAAATGVEISAVAQILAQWCSEGTVVRCELPLRSGFDRFEYRLSHSIAIRHGRSYPKAVLEELA